MRRIQRDEVAIPPVQLLALLSEGSVDANSRLLLDNSTAIDKNCGVPYSIISKFVVKSLSALVEESAGLERQVANMRSVVDRVVQEEATRQQVNLFYSLSPIIFALFNFEYNYSWILAHRIVFQLVMEQKSYTRKVVCVGKINLMMK